MSAAKGSDRKDAPDAEHDAKPDSPDDIDATSWKYILRKTYREFTKDQCTDLAAALTYYAVLALFPALIALLSLVALFGQGPSSANTLIGILEDLGAGTVASTIEPTLRALSTSSGGLIAFIVGIASALWSASGYVGAFGRAQNRMYEIGEGRPFYVLRPVMLAVTAAMVVMVALVLLALVLTGPAASAVGSALGIGSTAVTVWNIAKWPVILAVVVVAVALLYWSTPNIEQPKFRWVSIGALLAIVVWAIATALFGFYVANFSSYNKTYGSLAGVIVFLLWLWLTNLALLFGAELDSELERGRELQAGMEAEDTLQLPPRSTKKLEKAEEQEQEDIERGRAIREKHAEESEESTGAGDSDDRSGSKGATRAKR